MEICKHKKMCGGCQYMGTEYPKQLEIKKDYCIKLLEKASIKNKVVAPTNGVSNPYFYRNKIIVAFNNKYEYGLYEENSHKVIPYQRCLLHEEISDQIIHKIAMLFKKYRVSIYDEKRQRGLIRHVLIRRAVKTNQTMVVLVCNEEVFQGSKNFCNEIIKAFPTIKTVVLNVNKRKTSVVLGDKEKVLYGKGFIVDELCGINFKISAKSFYQINHDQCVEIYKKAIDLLELKGNEIVIDTYCGIGTIGMVASKKAKQVIGVELNKDAVFDAKNNAKMNNITNIQFYQEDATQFMQQMANKKQKVDVLIMDPPRAGSTKEFIDALKVLKPKKVVYISCDPSTQVRDLKYLHNIGYHFNTLYPYDMFPFTKHVETVCLLTKL